MNTNTEHSPRGKPTVARVKWLERKSHNITEPLMISDTLARYHYEQINHNFSKNIKHLSILDRLKRMFKKLFSAESLQ